MSTRTTEQIETDIAARRRDIAETVDALGEKLDVGARIKDAANHRGRAARDHWPVLAGAGAAVVVVTVVVLLRRRR